MFLKMLLRIKEKCLETTLMGYLFQLPSPNKTYPSAWENFEKSLLSNINVSCCNLTSCPVHCRADRLYEEQPVKYRLEKWTVRWTENWLNCQAERTAVIGTECNWGPVSRGEPQGLVPGSVPFNIFINHLQAGTENTLSKPAGDTKVKEAADAPEGCAGIQRDFDRLEKWADGNPTEFSKRKSKILPLGSKNPMPQ